MLYLIPNRNNTRADELWPYPHVSILISAHNEENCIARKLDNTLNLDYPEELLHVIVISDASSDYTDNIVHQYKDRGVHLIRLAERRGKSAGLNEAIRVAEGDIILMTDANAILGTNSLRELIKAFSDPAVGFVTGWTRYTGNDRKGVRTSAGLYTLFETYLKTQESLVTSCVGADGAIFAMRRNLYEPLLDHDINDFILPLKIVKNGYRGVFEAKVACDEEASCSHWEEFRRQVRITNRALRAIFRYRELLNPLKYGWFSVSLFSHKLLRFLSPYFLILLFLSTTWLLKNSQLYQVLFTSQCLMYVCAFIGVLMPKQILPRPITLCTHFVIVNLAYLVGWIRFLSGSLDSVWERTSARQGSTDRPNVSPGVFS